MTNDKLKCYLSPECIEIALFSQGLVCTSQMGFGNSYINQFEEVDYEDL